MAEVNVICRVKHLFGGQVSAGDSQYHISAETGLLHRVGSGGAVDPISGVLEADTADLYKLDGRTWALSDVPVKRASTSSAKTAKARKTEPAPVVPDPPPLSVPPPPPIELPPPPGGEPFAGGVDPGTYASRLPPEEDGPNVLKAQEWYDLAVEIGLPLAPHDIQLSKPELIAKIRSLAAERDQQRAAGGT